MTREEASNILDDYDVNFEGHTAEEIAKAFDVAFKALEQEPCDKCVYSTKDGCCQYDDITKTIPPFEPCEDAISRQVVQDYIAKYLSQYLYEDIRQAIETIDTYIGDMPSVNPQEPKTDALYKIISKIEDQEKWLMQAGYNHYNVDIAFDAIKAAVAKGR